METHPATMAKTARRTGRRATHRHRGLPDEIAIWEILVRLPPQALLRCRAVCRTWRQVTSARDFLLAHHGRQPSLQILYGSGYGGGVRQGDILAFDNQAATTAVRLHNVARLDEYFSLQASCDGLLVISGYGKPGTYFSFCCNPATRQHIPLEIAQDMYIVGMYMYPHRPTDQYRLLLQRRYPDLPEKRMGFYGYALGSNQPPRYIGWRDTASAPFSVPARVLDSLHWYQTKSQVIIVFNTIAESFRPMRAPTVPSNKHISHIFETDGTLGIHNHDDATEIINIWVMQNYEDEVWDLKYQIKLPVADIKGRFEGYDKYCYVNVALGDGRVFLLVNVGQWVLHINSDGKLVDSFHSGVGRLCAYGFRLKQTLVPHTFFRH